MQCGLCGLISRGERCENPGCKSNAGQYSCPTCGLISTGTVCRNPGCQKLLRSGYQNTLQSGLEVDLSWGELLQELDAATGSYIREAKKQPRMVLQLSDNSWLIDRPKGAHWLWLCSYKAGAKLLWVPAQVLLRYGGEKIAVTMRGGFDVRVHFPASKFPRSDLRYFEIGEIFTELGRDAEVAAEMLVRVCGGFNQTFGPYDSFIDTMIVLMFGVEAARNWATCSTSLMMLELVASGATYGRSGTKVFTMAKAFHHEYKMWDEQTFYGGKHPMGTHGTGPGNLIDRGKIVRSKGEGWEEAVSLDRQRHAVIYRELSIMKHWLRLTETRVGYANLTPYLRILKLLRTHLA